MRDADGRPERGLRVLYANHTSQVSGGERSLLTALEHLPPGVVASVASPVGPLADAVRALEVPVIPVPGTAGSLKLHPTRTARALAELGREGRAVRRAARAGGFGVVHANSIRAAVACALAPARGMPPLVAHVRDCLPPGPASSLVLRLIARRATLVVANSSHTEASVRRAAPRASTRVLHSPVDLDRFDPSALDRESARRRLGLDPDAPVLAVVAQITPWKGQQDAIRALAAVRRRHPGARLLLAGSAKFVDRATRYDNREYVRRLEELIGALGLEAAVTFLGERSDVPEILRAVDVALVPSWEEPFGRAVVEAMAMEVPVIATDRGGPAEILRDGEDGLLLPPRAPERWAAAVEELIDLPERRAAMGRSGAERARLKFGAGAHAVALARLYEDVAGVRLPRAGERPPAGSPLR